MLQTLIKVIQVQQQLILEIDDFTLILIDLDFLELTLQIGNKLLLEEIELGRYTLHKLYDLPSQTL
jgi:hypothetical protein